MTRVKVIGAGSIGNHLAHAARCLGWSVDICDCDPTALQRTKQQIYPARYGAWDEAIRLFMVDAAPIGGYDLICVGTPPDTQVEDDQQFEPVGVDTRQQPIQGDEAGFTGEERIEAARQLPAEPFAWLSAIGFQSGVERPGVGLVCVPFPAAGDR